MEDMNLINRLKMLDDGSLDPDEHDNRVLAQVDAEMEELEDQGQLTPGSEEEVREDLFVRKFHTIV